MWDPPELSFSLSLMKKSTLRIILDSEIPSTMLELPKKFARVYGSDLPDSVTLETPCGSKWAVSVSKRGRLVWLEKGWPDFAAHFSISYGHLLFFRYDGNSNFKVSICDSSTCQISYPSRPMNKNKKANVNVAVKRGRGRPRKDVKQTEEGSSSREDSDSEHSIRSPRCRRFNNTTASLEANNFFSTLPFFRGTIGKGRNYNLHVRKSFGQGYLKKENQTVTLRTKNRAWVVRLIVCQSGYFICRGFSKFVKDNKLRRGDVCVYELLDRNAAVLQVSIFRN